MDNTSIRNRTLRTTSPTSEHITSQHRWNPHPQRPHSPKTGTCHQQCCAKESHLLKLRSRAPFESHSRAGSTYTLSRVSFSSQVAQLDSVRLPQASLLAKAVCSTSTAPGALGVLDDAAYQIKRWIRKATDVLNGLDAAGEIEWAVAAGRRGIAHVNLAIECFEVLINTYVTSVENLQLREDVSRLSAKDLNHTLDNIEVIANLWQEIKETLASVKTQVELSLEWEELQNTIFQQIEAELTSLSKIVFQTEEKRQHQRTQFAIELEVTETSAPHKSNFHSDSASESSCWSIEQQRFLSTHNDRAQDETLLALSSRMQPLRASLDFLPIRYATFRSRALAIFPSACEGLEEQMHVFERRWTRLVSDADTLRKELGEDKWAKIFEDAATQALQMIESVKKSIIEINESLNGDIRPPHAPNIQRQLEIYHRKKLHYCPAIMQIISITSQGLRERSTANGKIERLQADVCQSWSVLETAMENVDEVLDSHNNDNNFGESMSSLPSSTYSRKSSPIATPRSSPPSSVATVSTKSSHQHLHKSASLESNLVTPPSSMRTRRTAVALNLKPSTSLPLLMHVAPHAAKSRTCSTVVAPTPMKHAKSSPIGCEKPRWNYSTKIEYGINTDHCSTFSAMAPRPKCNALVSSSISTSSTSAVQNGGFGAGPSSSSTPIGSLKSKGCDLGIRVHRTASSSTPVKVLRVPSSTERVPATTVGAQNNRILRTKPSQGLLPSRNGSSKDKTTPTSSIRSPLGLSHTTQISQV